MADLLEKGLPTNTDCERFVLGSILLDDSLYVQAAGALDVEDFSTESHRRIFKRMGELQERQESIAYITVHNELMKFGESESCGGLSYLIELTEGIPLPPNIESPAKIVKEKARLRNIIFASQHMMNRALSAVEDSSEILSDSRDRLLAIDGSGAQKGDPQTPLQIVEEFPGGINDFLDPSKRAKGLSTGFYKFDDYTGGFHAGDLVIIAGRPSAGKTAIAINIAQFVAVKHKLPVAIFSLEMSKESLLTRMLCSAARVDSQKFRAGYLNQEERRKLNQALHELVEAPLHIDDTADMRLMDVHAKLRRLQAKQKLGLVIVDYLQLMATSAGAENRTQAVTALSRGLKLMAKELHVPMVVLSQLSRAVEQRKGDHRPQLSDLRESGAIEQDADLVAFVFREELYKPKDESVRGLAELIIAKQRQGPTGTAHLIFLHGLTKFENRVSDVEPPMLGSAYDRNDGSPDNN